MKVITKQIIDQWNDDHKLEQMKHAKEMRQQINPPRQRPLRPSSASSRPHRVNPIALMNALNKEASAGGMALAQAQAAMNPCSQYTEYKDSIKRTTASIVSSCVGTEREKGNLKEKILSSGDIASICSKKLAEMGCNMITSEWAVLALTVAGKVLETKWENRTGGAPLQ
jgi:hypothetical protein